MPSEAEYREQARFDQSQNLKREYDSLQARFESACDLLARMQAHLDQTGLAKLGESYVDTVLPRLIAKYDELRAENERIKANHVTVAEEVQRRHDACAPLSAEIERLRSQAEGYEVYLATRSLLDEARTFATARDNVLGGSQCVNPRFSP